MAGTTTVVFTDITGSSALVERLGDEDAATVVSNHLRVVRTETERWHGRVTKTLGDGIMAVYTTAYDAVSSAVAMQQAAELASRRGDTPALGLRIGIHVGDVIDDGPDDVFGAVVVVARRLCDAAQADQILASDLVRMLVSNRPDTQFTPLGALTPKGLTRPIRISQVVWAPLPAEPPLRVIVADDATLIRTGLVRLLSDSGFDVIGEASDYESLVSAVDRMNVQLVITDIRMPPGQSDEGLRAAEYIRANHPEVAVLILSQYVEASAATNLLEARSAGVGYLLKERIGDVDEFVEAARAVANGRSVIDPLVTDQLMSRRRANDNIAALSERERNVVELMAQGMSNQGISERLYLSPKTVETHIRAIFNKLDLPDDADGNRRVQAVIKWLAADKH